MQGGGEEAEMGGFGCILPFDTDHPEFTRGFEAGRLWGLLSERPDDVVEETAHASNAEMFLRMGEALGRPVRCEELDEAWLTIFFDPAGVVEAQ